MTISEKDIEDYLFRYPAVIKHPLIRDIIWVGRQLRVPTGIIDLIGISHKRFIVVEVKNTPLFSKHITQVCRYCADIEAASEEAGVNINPWPILISPYKPSGKFIIEATMLNVSLFTIDINNGETQWNRNTCEYTNYRSEFISTLSHSKIFKDFAESHGAKHVDIQVAEMFANA